jgi:invasion protein IalB
MGILSMSSRLIAAAVLAASFSSFAATPAQAPAPQAKTAPAPAKPAAPPARAAASDGGDEVVCTVERTLGSHLPKRTCTTRAAREEQAKADQQAMRNMHTSKANSVGR